MALILQRAVGEAILIGDDIRVEVVDLRCGRVRLAVTAPDGVEIDRDEIRIRKIESELIRRRNIVGNQTQTPAVAGGK